jgi:heme A synthase
VPDFARFYRFTVLVLIFNLAVIVWGGYVRASGAGAGCGRHWPDCNGQVIPRSPGTKTMIEFTHRSMSGGLLVLVVAQLVWAWRIAPRRHPVRRWATAVFGLVMIEALLGAGLVIFEMVAGNKSVARAYWMASHLLNTFALLGAMAILVQRARRPSAEQPAPIAGGVGLARALGAGLAVVLVIAISGAVVALGDTLFPAQSLAHGLAQDFSPSAHVFVRLRMWHPVFAVTGGLYLLALAAISAGRDKGDGRLRGLGLRLAAAILLQLSAGVINLLLLAPTGMQLVHLLLADLVWVSLVWLTTAVVDRSRAPRPVLASPLAPASA